MPENATVFEIAVPTPLYRTFDYLPPASNTTARLCAGMRVRVPFGRTHAIGVVLSQKNQSHIEKSRLKKISAVLDEQALLPDELMRLLGWVCRYYHCPPGECYSTALPVLLRQGEDAVIKGIQHWHLTEAGKKIEPATLKRAPRQAELLNVLQQHPEGANKQQLEQIVSNWQSPMRELVKKDWVVVRDNIDSAPVNRKESTPPPLNEAQQKAVDSVRDHAGLFQPFLLEGVTGSGKTEVYLNIIQTFLAQNRQVLVLVPEIGLTPQLLERFEARLQVPIAVLHSGLNDQERLNAWLRARDGHAQVVIGTRSAIFTPLKNPGLIIIDEEHDLSLKQQDGFRYHARDIAVMRAHQLNIPIVLGSATPSLESLYNAGQGKYQLLKLPERAGIAVHPGLKLIDLRRLPASEKLSPTLITEIKTRLDRKEQVLLFLNRRGFAPTLICHDCGWIANCERCNTHMTYHRRAGRLRCHHCGVEQRVPAKCPGCHEEDLQTLGQGTERIEDSLTDMFPGARVLRIDRDSTRRKGSLQTMLDDIHAGDVDILVGTQMLAKGHDFPNVTLVGILDMDQGLMSADFRASERMAQLLVQVAGRAGRAEKPGEVLIQTHFPEHPLLITLLKDGYNAFAHSALNERQQTVMPPFSSLALLRAESVNEKEPIAFLTEARKLAEPLVNNHEVFIMGPVPAPMEKRAGRYRAQLLLQAGQRNRLQALLDKWASAIDTIKSSRKVRWSLDIDPMEMY